MKPKFWVVSAKRDATRDRRLAQLIADSAAGKTVAPLTRPVAKHTAKPKIAAPSPRRAKATKPARSR